MWENKPMLLFYSPIGRILFCLRTLSITPRKCWLRWYSIEERYSAGYVNSLWLASLGCHGDQPLHRSQGNKLSDKIQRENGFFSTLTHTCLHCAALHDEHSSALPRIAGHRSALCSNGEHMSALCNTAG